MKCIQSGFLSRPTFPAVWCREGSLQQEDWSSLLNMKFATPQVHRALHQHGTPRKNNSIERATLRGSRFSARRCPDEDAEEAQDSFRRDTRGVFHGGELGVSFENMFNDPESSRSRATPFEPLARFSKGMGTRPRRITSRWLRTEDRTRQRENTRKREGVQKSN